MTRTAITLLLLLLCAPAASAQDLPSHDTGHYTLLTDLPRDEVRPLSAFLEAMFATYRETFPEPAVREVERATVRVYRSEADYHAYRAASAGGANANARGYFSRAKHELVSYRGATLADLYSILSHEGFHQFAWQYVVPLGAEPLPHWYEEGLADYFRTADVSRGRLKNVRLDYNVAMVHLAIREGRAWTLEQILYCDPSTMEDAGVFRAYYAHTYVFMEWMVARERKSVLRVYSMKRDGRPNAEIMAEIFGEGREARIYAAFIEYARRG